MSISKTNSNDPIIGCEYVLSSEIDSESRISSSKIAIVLVTGKLWKPIYFTPGSAVLTTEESMPPAGRLIESKFQMNTPGSSDSLSSDITIVCGRSVAIKLTFKSGTAIICGGKNRKLRLQDAGSMGQKSGHVIGFVYKSSKDFMWLNL